MKNYLLITLLISIAIGSNAQTVQVRIIRSQGVFGWAGQDTIWLAAAQALGYQAQIESENILNNTAFISTTDVLVCSESYLNYSGTQFQNIINYIKQGKSAYIQSEYESTSMGSILFKAIMDSAGADFHWINTVSGQLGPLNVLGTFSNTPNNTGTLDYFNYGLAGTGTGVDCFLKRNNDSLAFYFRSCANGYGKVITVSDEDWIWQNENQALNENILYELTGVCNATGIQQVFETPVTIYPNPAANSATVILNENRIGKNISITDVTGRVVFLSPLGEGARRADGAVVNLETGNWPNGIYFICVGGSTQKLIISK